MPIKVSPDYWSASIKPSTKANGITKQDREAAYELLEKLYIAGKGQKYRYPSDRRFKTEADAKAYWYNYTSAYGLLDKVLDIHRGFSIGF